jgi:hypothetical protein
MSKRQVVQLYKFEKVPNIRGHGQEYKVTNNLTGEVVNERTPDLYGRLREKGRELYFMDTKTRVADEDQNSDDEGGEGLGGGSASSKAALTVKKTLIREYNMQQKYDILNEILYGQHLNKEGETIDAAQRSKHGNNGLFFASVCAILNDGKSYPSFSKAKAVQATVKSFSETAITNHRARLVSRLGENFLHHDSFMAYSSPSTSDEEEELNEDFYQRQILMFLDALVFADASENKDEVAPEPRHSEEQEKVLQDTKIDGKKNAKRPRVEKVRAKPIDHVTQLQEQQSGLTGLINSIVTMASDGPRPAAAEAVDPGVLAIKSSLTALPAPPGLPAVCQKLAEGLAGYGFCTLQELLEIRDRKYDSASAILKELHWSVLQIERVLGEPSQ